MSIRAAIYDLMNNVETDVYPVLAPADLSDPYCVYNISREPIRTQDGIEDYGVTLTVDCYSKNHLNLISFAATIEANMENASGTYQSTTIDVCNFISEGEVSYDADLAKYSLTQTYEVIIDN